LVVYSVFSSKLQYFEFTKPVAPALVCTFSQSPAAKIVTACPSSRTPITPQPVPAQARIFSRPPAAPVVTVQRVGLVVGDCMGWACWLAVGVPVGVLSTAAPLVKLQAVAKITATAKSKKVFRFVMCCPLSFRPGI
jgi:hypothetical protein